MNKQYFVYTNDATRLELHGEVYIPKLKTDWVILTTDLEESDIAELKGVYKVVECRTGSLCEAEVDVHRGEGSYFIGYKDKSRVIINEIGSIRDAETVLRAINDGVLSINGVDVAEQIKRMFKALEEIETEALQYAHGNRCFRRIYNAAKLGLGKPIE